VHFTGLTAFQNWSFHFPLHNLNLKVLYTLFFIDLSI